MIFGKNDTAIHCDVKLKTFLPDDLNNSIWKESFQHDLVDFVGECILSNNQSRPYCVWLIDQEWSMSVCCACRACCMSLTCNKLPCIQEPLIQTELSNIRQMTFDKSRKMNNVHIVLLYQAARKVGEWCWNEFALLYAVQKTANVDVIVAVLYTSIQSYFHIYFLHIHFL